MSFPDDNHGLAERLGLERTAGVCLVPRSKRGQLEPDGSVQPGFEYLQGWGLQSAQPADRRPPGAPSCVGTGPQQAHTSGSRGAHQKAKNRDQKSLGAVSKEVVACFFILPMPSKIAHSLKKKLYISYK